MRPHEKSDILMTSLEQLDDKVESLKFNTQTVLFLSAVNTFMNVATIVVAAYAIWP